MQMGACEIHFGGKVATLKIGDLITLNALLPRQQLIADLFHAQSTNEPLQLMPLGAGRLLQGLRSLDLSKIDDEIYVSSPSPRTMRTKRELVEELIKFLQAGLRTSTR